MDVKEIQEKKRELESDLLSMITEKVAKFREELNCNPVRVSVYMMDVAPVSGYSMIQVLNKVNVHIEI